MTNGNGTISSIEFSLSELLTMVASLRTAGTVAMMSGSERSRNEIDAMRRRAAERFVEIAGIPVPKSRSSDYALADAISAAEAATTNVTVRMERDRRLDTEREKSILVMRVDGTPFVFDRIHDLDGRDATVPIANLARLFDKVVPLDVPVLTEERHVVHVDGVRPKEAGERETLFAEIAVARLAEICGEHADAAPQVDPWSYRDHDGGFTFVVAALAPHGDHEGIARELAVPQGREPSASPVP